MKNLFFSIALALASFAFVACDDDVDTTEGSVSSHPAQDAAGTYNGTFLKIANSDSTYLEGSVTLQTVDGEPYVALISVTTEDGTYDGSKSQRVNIVSTDRGFFFGGTAATIGDGGINGTIGAEQKGQLKADFYGKVKNGKKTVLTYFYFTSK